MVLDPFIAGKMGNLEQEKIETCADYENFQLHCS